MSGSFRYLFVPQLEWLLSDVATGRIDVASRLAEWRRSSDAQHAAAPLLYFDNDSSPRYTILEVVADDTPGLLHRISRALSSFGCEVDLVLISTEQAKAIDVFHLRRGDAKLTESDHLALTEQLERAIAASA